MPPYPSVPPQWLIKVVKHHCNNILRPHFRQRWLWGVGPVKFPLKKWQVSTRKPLQNKQPLKICRVPKRKVIFQPSIFMGKLVVSGEGIILQPCRVVRNAPSLPAVGGYILPVCRPGWSKLDVTIDSKSSVNWLGEGILRQNSSNQFMDKRAPTNS